MLGCECAYVHVRARDRQYRRANRSLGFRKLQIHKIKIDAREYHTRAGFAKINVTHRTVTVTVLRDSIRDKFVSIEHVNVIPVRCLHKLTHVNRAPC